MLDCFTIKKIKMIPLKDGQVVCLSVIKFIFEVRLEVEVFANRGAVLPHIRRIFPVKKLKTPFGRDAIRFLIRYDRKQVKKYIEQANAFDKVRTTNVAQAREAMVKAMNEVKL